ncbi:MAG: CNNM domain-containing protein [Planctomycetota bacterium]|nr:CNNM domain-containing protein [Planctomycetota bacterium]
MILSISIGIVALFICGLLAGMETGIYTLNRVRLAAKAAQNSPSAKRIRAELLHPNRLLATLLVGMNLAHAALSAATTSVVDMVSTDPVQIAILNTVVVLPLVFLFGDALPKELFRVFTNSWTYGCSSVLLSLRILLTWTGLVPAVRFLGDTVSYFLGFRVDQQAPNRQRILQSLRDGIEGDLIKPIHLEMADRVFGLAERSVADCAIPWSKVFTLSADATQENRTATFSQYAFSRLPITTNLDGKISVVGVVSALDAILQPTIELTQLAQEPLIIEPKTLVMEAARRLRAARRTMAIVADGPGASPIGIITLKDVVEPIFGPTPEW